MKKIVLVSCVILGSLSSSHISEAKGNDEFHPLAIVDSSKENPISNAVVNPGSGYSWEWFYTDHSLSDGWYEEWYKDEDGAGTHYMVKTYNSNGTLMRTRYL
ncbi:hypothetical protein QTG56_24550 (plasmid) [Rossellomorea sp. AcN35-11]|nr:hypothetical protein [Rossellomorea aquimaris]WJV31806.1 hypothetical protein QTG56_24550 [Rossellomorea sp. AcN35-11]